MAISVIPASNLSASQNDLDDPEPWQLFFMWVIPTCIVMANMAVFMTVPRTKSLSGPSAMTMLCLGLADFCVGITPLIKVISFSFIPVNTFYQSRYVCIAEGYIACVFNLVSVWILTLASVDKFCKLAYPFRYPVVVTGRRYAVALVGLWLGSVVLNSFYLFGAANSKYIYSIRAFTCLPSWTSDVIFQVPVFMAALGIPFCVSTACYIGIFRIARKHVIQIQVQQVTLQGATQGDGNQPKKEWQVVKTLTYMTIGFYVAWTPFIINFALSEMITGRSLSPWLDFPVAWLAISNSSWNFLMYVLTIGAFRKSCARWMRCPKMRSSESTRNVHTSNSTNTSCL